MELSELLQMMKDRKASVMFLTAGLPPMMKVGGKTAPISDKVLTPEVSMAVVTGMMSPAQREEFEATKECNFAISDEEIGRFRVSAFIQSNYAGAVLRRIENFIPSIEDLNLPPILKNLSMTKRGLIVFIGSPARSSRRSAISLPMKPAVDHTAPILSVSFRRI